MTEKTKPVKVLVTGATGYVASHVVAFLLEKGYHVRGTVRDPKRAVHLQAMIDAGKPLELFAADLLQADRWPAAMEGCTFVMHVASPVSLECPDRLGDQLIVRPAVEGTMNILRAAAAAGIKRVVLTSSLAAIASPGDMAKRFKEGKAIDPSMWVDPDIRIPYFRSKSRAERAAWDFVKTPEANGMELVTICPGVVIGPSLNANKHEGLDLIIRHLKGHAPLIPLIQVPAVHVMDVTEAHWKGMILPEAQGQRFLLVSEVTDAWEMAQAIRPIFKPMGYRISKRKMKSWAVPLFRKLDPMIGQTWEMDRVKCDFNTEASRTVLGVLTRDCTEGLKKMAFDCVEKGFVHKTKKYLKYVKEHPEAIAF